MRIRSSLLAAGCSGGAAAEAPPVTPSTIMLPGLSSPASGVRAESMLSHAPPTFPANACLRVVQSANGLGVSTWITSIAHDTLDHDPALDTARPGDESGSVTIRKP